MEINRADRNFKEIGHLLIGFSLADKVGDLDFPRGQAVIEEEACLTRGREVPEKRTFLDLPYFRITSNVLIL